MLLNLSPDHLDRHARRRANTPRRRRRIFANQADDDWAVVNADDPATVALARGVRARRLGLALDGRRRDGVVVAGDGIVRRRRRTATSRCVPLASIRLPGRHMLADVLAAAAVGVARRRGAGGDDRAVESFARPRARARAGGAKSAACGSSTTRRRRTSRRRAARSRASTTAWSRSSAAGSRGATSATCASRSRRARRRVVAIGEATAADPRRRSATSCRCTRPRPCRRRCGRRSRSAPPGGTVVLAPACSSFDMFRDYAERGRAFKQEVARLQEHGACAGAVRAGAEGRERRSAMSER